MRRRYFRVSYTLVALLVLAAAALSWPLSQMCLWAIGPGGGMANGDVHPPPGKLLADQQQRLQADATREMRRVHTATTSWFVQRPGFGSGRLAMPERSQFVKPAVDARSNVLSLAADPWTLPTWTEGELAATDEGRVAEDLKILYADSSRDFTRAAATNRYREKAWEIKSLDLVGLVKHERPVAYITDQIRMNKLKETPIRELDFFEAMGVDQLKNGKDLYSRNDRGIVRMLGAIRAETECLSCHQVEKGTLLGAFSYTLRQARFRWTAQADVARLRQVTAAKAHLIEQSRRADPTVARTLARAAAANNPDIRAYAQSLLDDYLYREPIQSLRLGLLDKDAELRQSAATVLPAKQPTLVRDLTDDLIRLVADREPKVRETARRALVKLNNGTDYGPADLKDASAAAEAERKWRSWWATQKSQPNRSR